MKDPFEDFVQEHRDEFDIHIPDPSVWEKIAKKQNHKNRFTRKKILKIAYRAAAVAGIFFLSYAFHELRNTPSSALSPEKINQDIYLALPDLKETEMYYNKQVNVKLEELKPFLSRQPEMNSLLKEDLSELDSIYNSLKYDLKDNIANQQVLEAMIQNYRIKLQILEDLLLEVTNQEHHEKDNNKYPI